MNILKENMVAGLLLALAIGPSLSPSPNLSLAVRLSSLSLLATGRLVAELSDSAKLDFKRRSPDAGSEKGAV